ASVYFGRRIGICSYGNQSRNGHRYFCPSFVILLGDWDEPFYGNCENACRKIALGKIDEAIQSERRKIIGFAYALSNFRLELNRTRPIQQRGSYGYRGNGSSVGRNAISAY